MAVETPARLAEATVWGSGEVNPVIGNLAARDIEPNEHTELTTYLGARGLFFDMAWAITL